jgi:subtilase family serine protease
MRELGLGITNSDLLQIPTKDETRNDSDLYQRLSGRILLQVESNGEAWYVNPVDLRRYFLGRPSDAFEIMRGKGLGITDSDLEKVAVHEKYKEEIQESKDEGEVLGEQVKKSEPIKKIIKFEPTPEPPKPDLSSEAKAKGEEEIAKKLPDLFVEHVAVSPDILKDGTVVSFTVTIKNKGQGTANASNVRLRIGTGYNDIWYTETDEFLFTKLLAGTSQSVTVKNVWTAESGTSVYEACADFGDTSTESNETNNCESYKLTAYAEIDEDANLKAGDPDLIAQLFNYSPDNPTKGDKISFSGTIKNIGESVADVTRARLRIDLDADNTWDVGFTDVPVSSLGSGALRITTWSSAWIAEAGTHIAEICADGGSAINELVESNNCATAVLIIGGTTSIDGADLVSHSISLSSENLNEGDSVSFSGNVENYGKGAAGAFVALLRIDIDNNNTWDKEDAFEVSSLATGAAKELVFSYNWITTPGTHFAEICADNGDSIVESNEYNNCVSTAFEVAPTLVLEPDLIVSSIEVSPQSPKASDHVSFTADIFNVGEGPATATLSRLRIDLNSDGYYDSYPSDYKVSPIWPDNSATSYWTLIWEALTGTHTFEFCADNGNAVNELDETNNCATSVLNISSS